MADTLVANTRLGRFVDAPVAGEVVRAFVLPPLPPTQTAERPFRHAEALEEGQHVDLRRPSTQRWLTLSGLASSRR
jgi:hypothetical protein